MAPLVKPTPSFWSGRRVFLTGHTGFKGSWLMVWLETMGAIVTGYALEPETTQSLWTLVERPGSAAASHIGDIRDGQDLARRMREAEPELVLHLAAQALVRSSYKAPVDTITSNVVGTVNVLEAVRACGSVKAVVSVTTDKCYLNREWVWPYREDDALGGHDPYSASKACAEIVTAAWRDSFLAAAGVRVATARAGNVIGGGDWSLDRLLPDCFRALQRNEAIVIRNPASTRPWQHVLEPLSGYLVLAERLHAAASGTGTDVAAAWNFGPEIGDVQPVSALADRVVALWGDGARWMQTGESGPHEAGLLAVDATKARSQLGWRPRLPLAEALAWTVAWQRRYMAGEDARMLVEMQIADYDALS